MSPIQQAQKGARIEGVVRVLEAAERVAAFDQGVVNLIDAEAVVREVGDTYQAPLSILRSPDAVAALKRQQAEALARQQQIAEAQAGAGIVKDAAAADARSEERRVGKGCVRPGRSWVGACH